MGVHGLWKLLAPTGKPVTLESLEGKVLAVDVSIWLNQALYGMHGYQGSTRANAHLVVLFNRICKLLHYKIKPIFVFDGAAPELKKHTLNARRKRKQLAVARAKRATDRIVKNYLKQHALTELSNNPQSAKGRKFKLSRILPKAEKDASIFELPPLPEDAKQRTRTILDEKEDMYLNRVDQQEAVEAQFEDINDIDINSQEFRSLSDEIQHEVITNIRESRKKPFWSRFRELPKKADDFSSYQLSRLLKKGKMSHRLDELQKDMKTKTSGDLAVLLDYETRLEAFEAGRVASEDTQHYLLIKNQQKGDSKEKIGEMNTDEFQERESNQNIQSSSNHQSDRFDASDAWLVDNNDTHGRQMEISSEKKHLDIHEQPLDSKKWPSPNSEELQRKSRIKHEVWTFFQKYNSSAHGGSGDMEATKGDESKDRRSRRSLIIDEEELREESNKRKLDQTSENVKKRRTYKEKVLSEEETNMVLVKNVSLDAVSETKAQTRKFLGQSDVNLSDEYDSDNEEGGKNERSRDDVVEQTKNETIANEYSNTVDRPALKVTNSHSSEDTPNISANIPSKATTTERLVEMGKEENEKDERLLEDGSREQLAEKRKEEDVKDEALVDGDSGKELVEIDNKDKKDKKADLNIVGNMNGSLEEDEQIGITEPVNEGKDSTTKEDVQTPGQTFEIELVPSDEPIGDDLFTSNLEDSMDDDTLLEKEPAAPQESSLMFDQEDLDVIQEKLDLERMDLEKVRGKDQRMAASVTEAMYNDAKELLRLFGIPFIDSPQEAEAQCAFLDLSGQCQGIITDDSDVWLFGGQRIYKNFFSKDREVLFFHDQAIERQLTLDRCKLINLALLMGSDYTIGVQGVGFVTALEILSEFPGEGIEGLERFRKWWEDANAADTPETDSKIRSKLYKLILTPDFPSHVVVRAYLDPDVDKSKEKFTWNSPDLDLLRTFAQEKIGWIQSKTDEILLPVIKRLREKAVQGKISSYFFLQPNVDKERQKIKSKRLQAVLKKLSNPNEMVDKEDEESAEAVLQEKVHQKQQTTDGSRKQSKKSIKKKGNVHTIQEISDSSESDGETDEVSVARIAREFESDQGRHVWLGRANQRKLFAKNNKGYGRSWQKHNWVDDELNDDDDDDGNVGHNEPIAPRGKEEEETTTKKDVKPDSYWEDQISDTEYDLDELINPGSMAGKMIGGAAAGKIMTRLEKNYGGNGDEESNTEDRENDDDDVGKRKKKKTDSKKTHHKKQRTKRKDSSGGKGERTMDKSKQKNAKERRKSSRNDGTDSDDEDQGIQKQQKTNRPEKSNHEDEYRIEDEKEPERNEEDLRIQAKRKAKRNPYLRKLAIRSEHAIESTVKDQNNPDIEDQNIKKSDDEKTKQLQVPQIQKEIKQEEEKEVNIKSKENKTRQSVKPPAHLKRESLLHPGGTQSGRNRRGKGKGKQLLNRQTRYKSSVMSYGPALSESSSSDGD